MRKSGRAWVELRDGVGWNGGVGGVHDVGAGGECEEEEKGRKEGDR